MLNRIVNPFQNPDNFIKRKRNLYFRLRNPTQIGKCLRILFRLDSGIRFSVERTDTRDAVAFGVAHVDATLYVERMPT
ncbi:hypothetical protein [Burkholderia gladioli]|uniref:hypothetical protein n=1 Tax=Burkholderia gladioli TaxID=28095 RepID=UPI0011D1B4D7|nr:hypothetical protein [Burkholderia gladioli]MBW5287436.1 hypothetical protein [Burkholderia gladioli]